MDRKNTMEASVEEVHGLLVKPKALDQIAEVVADLMESEVCVVWKPSRTFKKSNADPRGRLYPYSSTFGKTTTEQHATIPIDLNLDTTGRFYKSTARSAYTLNFPAEDRQSPSHEFMIERKLKHVCMAKFTMSEKDVDTQQISEVDYAVGVYRRDDQPVFNPGDESRLLQIAGFLPIAYRQMVSSELKKVIGEINTLLNPKCPSFSEAKSQLRKLCARLGQCFNCREISIYLRDPNSISDTYFLEATTLEFKELKPFYKAVIDGGLTSYILTKKTLVWFNDLYNFQDEERLELIRARYPGIEWTNGGGLGKPQSESKSRPPLAFVGTPIFDAYESDNVAQLPLGAIRACGGTNPFYWLDDEFDVFKIIASEIGRWWKSIGHSLQETKRADVWQALNITLSGQHDALRRIDSQSEISTPLARRTVELLVDQPIFTMATFRRGSDVRNLRLVCCKFKPPKVSGSQFQNLPFGGNPEVSATTQGFHIGSSLRSADDIERSGSPEEQRLFKDLEFVYSLLLFRGNQLYGVLDVGFTLKSDFTLGGSLVSQFLEFTARQLALFEVVRESMEAVRTAKANELRTHEALGHQLTSPLKTALKRLSAVAEELKSSTEPEDVTATHPEARALRTAIGMVRKAFLVTKTIDMLSRIAKKEVFTAAVEPLAVDQLRKLALEICFNHRLLAPEQMRSQFRLEPNPTWGQVDILWNRKCTENSLDALISNAFKYSDPGEIVQVIGRLEGDLFAVQVVSRGTTLLPEDVSNCVLYEWRSLEAKKQEGAGVGLWVADHYMRIQGGKLRIYPTNSSGETMFELLFKIKKSL